MENPSVKNDTFHIGITMAGAVSAGCYTAGVMDYLFEILELWEEAKAGRLPEGWDESMLRYIPKHNVVIDAMGGASAGGMTTVMAAIYALKGKINPVKDPANPSAVKGNLLYDSWVLMGDTENNPEKVLEKAFNDGDLKGGKILSVLNSDFIDTICDTAFTDDVPDKKLPAYISEELEILLSQTMLRSVPMPINFSTPRGRLHLKNPLPEYNTFEHFVISHFKLDYDENNPLHQDFYLPFSPFSSDKNRVDTLKQATKATGAFPIALKYREFFKNEFTSEYIRNNSKKLLHNTMNPAIKKDDTVKINEVSNPFEFIGVDGGTINNEPIGEILNILKERHIKDTQKEEYTGDQFALIMIDPFPDHIYNEKYEQPTDVFSIVPSILGTLMDQARLKRREMMDFHRGNHFTGEVFPVRYQKNSVKEKNHIACSSVYAFGGFLDISFRHHDFFLGRDNARNFFNGYFSMEYDPANPHQIHKSWTQEMVDKFKVKDRVTGKYFLPIIPDLYKLKRKLDKQEEPNPFGRTVREWPKFDPEKLMKLRPKIEDRIKKMIQLTIDQKGDAKEKKEHIMTEKIIDQYYKKNFFTPIVEKATKFYIAVNYLLIKGPIASRITKSMIEKILKDLEDKDLLKSVK
ncbi:hypothetical protein CLU96_0795 [Chryseobacterium sp. 52]|uniref:patatin-like phospholipase family protein n=1 Tax=Chryseobacterium sp. 52 TaxID=2035213 RepID=UPI000C18522C|nr:patatin-like phospholipase family protein [Chryseobacterium sp. 52]PIF43875.1 hypothetical protein CLU96_0795 [Chryseobacterium sp. 52]